MNISDLNHLEVVNEDNKVVGRGSLNQYTYINKDVYIDFYEDVYVSKYLNTYSSVRGNSAFAEGDASASGSHTNAEAFSFSYTDPYFSSAGATSLSQTDGYYY
ncbi:MAG: hypothetical protein RID53_27120 [Coleofasciculus sp. B1-GNL1-01]|uniref:hypothetical protein n=1 Tax=Coleofasciculus sp. B1-GNL1-01 TaxID=3068484 RepID=UPI0032FFAB2A